MIGNGKPIDRFMRHLCKIVFILFSIADADKQSVFHLIIILQPICLYLRLELYLICHVLQYGIQIAAILHVLLILGVQVDVRNNRLPFRLDGQPHIILIQLSEICGRNRRIPEGIR